MIHSPFHVVEDFASPLWCESVLTQYALKTPDVVNNQPIKHERRLHETTNNELLSWLVEQFPVLENRYDGTVHGLPSTLFQQYWENSKAPAEPMGCESSRFMRKKWTKVKDVDLVGILWLKDYRSAVPLDPRFEVYGGKLEFPAYDFSLTPVRGTLVIFPATPHFITATSHVLFGSLEQIKIGIKLQQWQYDPTKFPGTYQEWFFNEANT